MAENFTRLFYFLISVVVAVAKLLCSPVAFNTTQNNFAWYEMTSLQNRRFGGKREPDENDVPRYHTVNQSVKSSIIPCDLLLMSNFLITGVLSRFCFPLSWFFCWFARYGPTLLCMVVWKNYTIPRSVALKSAKYKSRIAENSFILDAVSPALRELLSSSFEFLFLTVLCQSDDSLKDGAE